MTQVFTGTYYSDHFVAVEILNHYAVPENIKVGQFTSVSKSGHWKQCIKMLMVVVTGIWIMDDAIIFLTFYFYIMFQVDFNEYSFVKLENNNHVIESEKYF